MLVEDDEHNMPKQLKIPKANWLLTGVGATTVKVT
jgi:hypothetical protein